MFFKGRKRQQFLFFCFQIKHRKDEQKRMKKKQTLWNGVSVLIVAVLAAGYVVCEKLLPENLKK